MKGNIAGNKRENFSDEELFKLLPKRWNKGRCLKEVGLRAQQGCEKIDSRHCSLNDIWNVFKKFPECFLFDENVERIKGIYISQHTFQYGNNAVQVDNMQRAVKRMENFVKRNLYNDFLQLPEIEEKKEQNVEGNKQKTSYANLFDDEIEANDVKKKKIKRLTHSVKQFFEHDTTALKGFDENSPKVVKYLQRHDVETIGQLMVFLKDKNNSLKLRNISRSYEQQYENFMHTLFMYVNLNYGSEGKDESKIQTNSVGREKQVQPLQNSFESEGEFYAYLDTLPAENFEKGSEKMAKIAKMAAEFFDKSSKELLDVGFTEQEVYKSIEHNGMEYRQYVDKRRKELENKAAASRIKAKIDDIVDYKFDNSIRIEREMGVKHSHNPFADGREL